MKIKFERIGSLHLFIFFTALSQGTALQAASHIDPPKVNASNVAGRAVECHLARRDDQWQSLGVVQILFDESSPPKVSSIKMKEILSGMSLNLEYDGDDATYKQSNKWLPLSELNYQVGLPEWIVMTPKKKTGPSGWLNPIHEFRMKSDPDEGRYIQDLPASPENMRRRVEILDCSLRYF